jgi:hypothetical protein
LLEWQIISTHSYKNRARQTLQNGNKTKNPFGLRVENF